MKFRISFLAVVLCAAPPLLSTTFLVPSDLKMIRRSGAIVIGTVTDSTPRITEGGNIVTESTVTVERILKGRGIDSSLRIVEPGGVVGDRASGVYGVPKYAPGEHVLLFLTRNSSGEWATEGMALGKFNFLESRSGAPLLVRGSGGHEIFGFDETLKSEHVEKPRRTEEFLAYIRSVVRRQPADEDYFEEPGALPPVQRQIGALNHGFPANAYVLPPNGRWANGGTATFPINLNGATGRDYTGAAQRSVLAWNGDPDSTVNYSIGGSTTRTFNQTDGNNVIIFNVTDTGSQLGIGTWASAGIHSFAGENFNSILEGDVKISNGITSFSQATLDAVVMHELGHTLGFRHSDEQEAPMSTDAVMKARVHNDWGARTGSWDREALLHVYGTGTPGALPKGDANGDGGVAVSDVFYLVSFLFAGGNAPIGPADVNNDANVTVADVFYLVNFLFAGGPAPQ